MGNAVLAVYADALADPPIVTTYMQATHPRQTTIPRTYIVQDTISREAEKEVMEKVEEGNLSVRIFHGD